MITLTTEQLTVVFCAGLVIGLLVGFFGSLFLILRPAQLRKDIASAVAAEFQTWLKGQRMQARYIRQIED